MSLLSGLTYKRPIAAIVGMSGYLPLRDRLAELGAAENRQTPIWMGHGTSDPVVDFNVCPDSPPASSPRAGCQVATLGRGVHGYKEFSVAD